jgi:hypothetical protein
MNPERTESEADVFISYKREERDAVQIIADTLADLKVGVWFDSRLTVGGSFDEEIARALRGAKAVLICWTPAASASEWVRAEASMARDGDRLVACFLQPTALIPPFNLTHAEDLSAWAGQRDDPAWLKVLDRIGELVGRAGLSTYHAVMRPGATAQELKAWASANGDDPLADAVWRRLELLEGEDADGRRSREKLEAKARDRERKRLAARSRQLARERGLRDPARERRRWLMLAGGVALLAVVFTAGLSYVIDAQTRERSLRDAANTPAAVREFLAKNRWHPVARQAREKLAVLDSDAWRQASSSGTLDALNAYIADAAQDPPGQFLSQARSGLAEAGRVKAVQEQLSRMRMYSGPAHGALDAGTREAIRRFRYRWMLAVSQTIDAALVERLERALQARIHPRVLSLKAETVAPPTEDDFMHISERLGIDAATLGALLDVEAPAVAPAFTADGRLSIVFERRVFSRLTNHRFDTSHPAISDPRFDVRQYPREQAERWKLFEEAFALDADAAMKATSWGRFSILGESHAASGFQTVGELVSFLSESEPNQYEAVLLGFIVGRNLGGPLQRHDWDAFSLGYSGRGPVARQHADRLKQAYERRVAAVLGEPRSAVQ